MKRLIFLFALIAFVSVSCKKKYNWNCQCVLDGTTTTDYTISDQTQEDAQERCDTQKAVYEASVGVTTADCTLIQTN